MIVVAGVYRQLIRCSLQSVHVFSLPVHSLSCIASRIMIVSLESACLTWLCRSTLVVGKYCRKLSDACSATLPSIPGKLFALSPCACFLAATCYIFVVDVFGVPRIVWSSSCRRERESTDENESLQTRTRVYRRERESTDDENESLQTITRESTEENESRMHIIHLC
jgi:hypothetical protein